MRSKCVTPACQNQVRLYPPSNPRAAAQTGMCVQCLRKVYNPSTAQAPPTLSAEQQVDIDRKRTASQVETSSLRKKYEAALKHIDVVERERDAAFALVDPVPCVIEPRFGSGTSEGVVGVNMSDWHAEEEVNPDRINGLNAFNLDESDRRIKMLYQGTLRLTKLLQQDIRIDTLLVGLLGDFISGDIHEEVAEVCLLPPMEAIVFVQERMIGGFDLLLNHTKLNIHAKCHVGNHGRTTKTSRFATENGHSLEYLLYKMLASHYRSEPRIQFDIAEGPHSYANVYGKKLRFQHGHMVKYNGGVGGIYIPVNKAINEWNKGLKVDYDFMGHFHQQVDGNNFMVNGPLIGYNSFALSIKAPFDEPKQTLYLLDKKRGKTCVWPILFRK